MARKNDQRKERKAATRQCLIDAAKVLFRTEDYHDIGIRELAEAAGFSTGALYNNFPDGKEQLFTEAMGFPPPVDGPLTRAAPMLLKTIWQLHDMLDGLSIETSRGTLVLDDTDQARAAHDAIMLATSPLDGEAWARHLSSIRRDEPHTLAAGEPAASVPSDAAGDL